MDGICSGVSSVQPDDCACMEPSNTNFSDSLASHLTCCETFSSPHMLVPDPQPTSVSGSIPPEQSPAIHVEVLQQSCSSLSASVVREYAVAQLKYHPTAFGEFTLTEFDDPVLKEHVVSISVCDVPTAIQVMLFHFIDMM